jgi:hypothetical protein
MYYTVLVKENKASASSTNTNTMMDMRSLATKAFNEVFFIV